MGINRFDKAPEWKPWTLPYDLILKAADMTQQRWDKGVADSDKIGDELWKSVKTVPGSQDELVNLPALREKYNNMRSELINDPDISPTKFTLHVQQFVNDNKSLLDRMTNMSKLYDANAVTVNTHESDADWRAKNTYLPGSHVDPYRINSADPNTPHEMTISSKPTTNFTPFIVDNLIKGWAASNDTAYDPVTKQVISTGGKTIESLESIAETNTPAYMQSSNFADYVNSQSLDNIKPDDVLKSHGKSFFGGQYFGDLNAEQKAKAMIMMAGATQINQKESMTVPRTSTSRDRDNNDPEIANAYTALMQASEVSGPQIASALGVLVNESTGTFKYMLPAETPSTLGVPAQTVEEELNNSLLLASTDYLSRHGLYNEVTNLRNIKIDKDLKQFEVNFGTDPTKKANAQIALDKLNASYKNSELILSNSLAKMKNTPQFLGLLDMLNYNRSQDPKYKDSEPLSSVVDVTRYMREMQETKDLTAKKLTTNQAEVRSTISKSFFETDALQDIFIGSPNNVIDLGSHKVIKGAIVLGTQKQLEARLEAENPRILDVPGWDNNYIKNTFGTDLYSSFDKMIADNKDLFVNAGTNKDGEVLWGIATHVPINFYDINKQESYNKSNMTEGNADKFRQKYRDEAVPTFVADNLVRTMDMFTQNPKMMNTYATSLIGAISNYPPDLKIEVTDYINNLKGKDDKGLDTYTDPQQLAWIYQTISQFGSKHKELREYFKLVKDQKAQYDATTPASTSSSGNPINLSR